MRALLSFAILMFLQMNMQIAQSQDLHGEWATQGYSARVRIAPCTQTPALLCGEIVWLWEANDAKGLPLRDAQNPKAELRQRPLIGLSLLKDFRRESNAKWTDGSIYDPESGRTYRASLVWRSHDELEVEGCFLFVCQSQLWRRAASLCTP
jgi:uncharacterized protein (DUF2147 family)